MSKITIKGEIIQVGDIKKAGTGEVHEIILLKKYHDAQTGELKNEDFYPCQVWQKHFKAFAEAYDKSAKMEVTGFLNGRKVAKDGSSSFFLNFVATEFKSL